MKKIKLLLLSCAIFMLSGCVVATYDITINKNDTGEIMMTIAQVNSEDDTNFGSTIEEIPNATIEDITFEKNGQTYVGKKVFVPFSSIDELNEIFATLSTETDDSDDQIESDNSMKVEARRDGNKVFISLEADPETYEQSKMFLELIDLKFNLKVEGTVLTNNATTVEDNTYTWNYATLLKDGINFEYETESSTSVVPNDSADTAGTADYNYIILGIIGVMVITIIALSIACINTVVTSKKK